MHQIITRSCKVIIAMSLLLTSAMSNAQDAPNAQELADQWIMAYNDHNTAALSNLYAEDATLMLHGGPTIRGRTAIAELWAEDFQEDNPITTLQVTHTLEGVDMILVHGNYQVINRNTGILLGQGRFAHTWMQGDNGEWMLDNDLWNEPFEPYANR